MYILVMTIMLAITPQTINDLGAKEYKVRQQAIHTILQTERSEELVQELVKKYSETLDLETKLNLQFCIREIYKDLHYSIAYNYVRPCETCGTCSDCLYGYDITEAVSKRLDEMYHEFKKENNITTIIE
jgi:predicted aldo/keto reductase-like oxidoreductase